MDLIKKSLVIFSALLVIFSAKNSADAQKSLSSSSNSARAYFIKCQQYKDLWSSQNQISRQPSHPRNVNNLKTGVEKNKSCRYDNFFSSHKNIFLKFYFSMKVDLYIFRLFHL